MQPIAEHTWSIASCVLTRLSNKHDFPDPEMVDIVVGFLLLVTTKAYITYVCLGKLITFCRSALDSLEIKR